MVKQNYKSSSRSSKSKTLKKNSNYKTNYQVSLENMRDGNNRCSTINPII